MNTEYAEGRIGPVSWDASLDASFTWAVASCERCGWGHGEGNLHLLHTLIREHIDTTHPGALTAPVRLCGECGLRPAERVRGGVCAACRMRQSRARAKAGQVAA